MKAVFVFCEGVHDVHFLGRALRACRAYVPCFSIGDLPSPLDSFLKRRIESEQSKLDATSFSSLHRLLLPRLELVLKAADESRIVMLFACEGDGQSKNVCALLESLRKTFSSPAGATPVVGSVPKKNVTSWSTVIGFDADDVGVDGRLETMRTQYRGVFGDLSGLRESEWLDAEKGRVACVVFRSLANGLGTLEDVIGPLLRAKQPGAAAGAEAFIDGAMWDGCVVKGKTDPASFATLTKRKKAYLTVLGQFDHPSCSLAVFIAKTEMLTDEAIRADPTSLRLADLLAE